MPEYIIERLDTEEQLLVFESERLETAIFEMRRILHFKYGYNVEYYKTSAIFSIKLPFDQTLDYLVGEVGRSD